MHKVMGVLFILLALPMLWLTVALIVGWVRWAPPIAVVGLGIVAVALVATLVSRRGAPPALSGEIQQIHPGIRMHAVPVTGGIGLVFVAGYLFMFWSGAPTYRPIVLGVLALGITSGVTLILLRRK